MRKLEWNLILTGALLAFDVTAALATSAQSSFADDIVVEPNQWTYWTTISTASGPVQIYDSWIPAYNPDFSFNLSAGSSGAPTFSNGDAQFELPPANPWSHYFEMSAFSTHPISGGHVHFEFLLLNAQELHCRYTWNDFYFYVHDGLNIVDFPDVRTTFGNDVMCENWSTSQPVWVDVSEMSYRYPDPNPSPTPSPSAEPSPDPSASPTPSPTPEKEYVLIVSSSGNPVSDPISVLPSIDGCGRIATESHERDILVQCAEKDTGDLVSGCQVSAELKLGQDHGGHEHGFNTRPLGTIFPDELEGNPTEIPISGLTVSYESPEVSGEVNMVLAGTSPEGKPIASSNVSFVVTRGNFVALRAPGFEISVDSHSDGDRGTERMQSALAELMKWYSDAAQLISVNPTLKSEAGSLPHGGLFDYLLTWAPPHCGHRDGVTLDISYSSFDSYDPAVKLYLIVSLEHALKASNFTWKLETGAGGKHYHIHLN